VADGDGAINNSTRAGHLQRQGKLRRLCRGRKDRSRHDRRTKRAAGFHLKREGLRLRRLVVSAAEASLVDTTRTVVAARLTTREIESLPVNSRSPLDLIFTLGGVSEEPLSTRDLAQDRTSSRSTPEEAGIFSLSGGTAYSNNITIDAWITTRPRDARALHATRSKAIDEVQIIRNQFAAEYGRASGGRVNLRTRGGSNKFHGRGYSFSG